MQVHGAEFQSIQKPSVCCRCAGSDAAALRAAVVAGPLNPVAEQGCGAPSLSPPFPGAAR